MDGCPDRREALWSYVFDELPQDQKKSIAEHLGRCLGCRGEQRRMTLLLERIRTAGLTPHLDRQQSEEMVDRILDRTERRPVYRMQWRGFALRSRFSAIAAACALLIFIGVVGYRLADRGADPTLMSGIQSEQVLSPDKVEMLQDLDLLKNFQTVKTLVRVLNDTPQEKQPNKNNNALRNMRYEIETQLA